MIPITANSGPRAATFRRILLASAAILALPATPATAGDIVGSVADASGTVALQAAHVRIVELERVASASRDGSFTFADVPAGNYTLEATYVGAEAIHQPIAVPESGTVSAEFLLRGVSAQDILVVGQGANLASALSRKRASDTVSDVLSRDAIGQFPDQNVAESLRRLPGINILNDQGEGRFVSVRGLDPGLNATSLNGVRVPAPESDVRSVALDVISSDSIESIEVKKSLTPDMDGDTIGASIEIETTSAFDRRKDLLSVKAEGSYNDYSGELTPKGSLDFSTRLTDSFGISGGVSYYQRKFETDNVEADGWDQDDGRIFPDELTYRDYDVERKRLSANLSFDFKPSDTTKLYLRGVYAQFDDHEFRRATTFGFDAAPSGGSGSMVEYDDADGEINVERAEKDRFERQRIRSLVFGGETIANGWNVKYAASWSKSSEREQGSVDPAAFAKDFEDDGLVLGLDFADKRRPLYNAGGSAGAAADFIDAREYELDELAYTVLSDAQDEEYGLRLDVGREFQMDGGTLTVQAGGKARWRDKSYNLEAEYWENDAVLLSDFLGDQTYRLTDISPVTRKGAIRDFFFANRADFELNEADSLFDSAVEDYSISEDIMAGYLLGRWDSATLRVIGGVRYEHTRNDILANTVTLIEEDGTLPDGSTAGDDTVIVAPNGFKRSYGHWLPSLNVRWEPQRDLVMRVAGYRSIVRPNLSLLAPRFQIEQNDSDEREGTFGNPELKPYEAWNFDASLEYYLSNNGALTAAFFYKDVKNFAVEVSFDDPGTYNGIAYDEATIPANGPSAEIWGVELGYSQAFRFLPAPLDGLLLQANYTYTDATGDFPTDGDLGDLRKITLPATSKHTFNVALGYEKGPISLRAAGTYRSKYLDELGPEAGEDRYVDNHFQLDLSARYNVTKQVQLFYEWINVNNAKYFAYNQLGGSRNLYQFEEYGWTMKFGGRVSF